MRRGWVIGCWVKRTRHIFGAGIFLLATAGCGGKRAVTYQGYIEGEFVQVASPLAGELANLAVARGQAVTEGELLFELENGAETAARDEARLRLEQAEANLRDARLGRRPSEILSLKAQLAEARAALVLSEKEFARQQKLRESGVSSVEAMDRARAERDQDRGRVSRLQADLDTARLGSRENQIAAAEANVQAQAAALAGAQWQLDQKRQMTPKSGLVFDTLYREGDWVAAGRPVVALLPPENVKVRVFAPETVVGGVRPGMKVRVSVDGVDEDFEGVVNFVSPRAEYTPPVIYSQDRREKLVFLVEAVFAPEVAVKLHPGQPVDVELGD